MRNKIKVEKCLTDNTCVQTDMANHLAGSTSCLWMQMRAGSDAGECQKGRRSVCDHASHIQFHSLSCETNKKCGGIHRQKHTVRDTLRHSLSLLSDCSCCRQVVWELDSDLVSTDGTNHRVRLQPRTSIGNADRTSPATLPIGSGIHLRGTGLARSVCNHGSVRTQSARTLSFPISVETRSNCSNRTQFMLGWPS